MLILVLLFATALLAVWFLLLSKATLEDWESAALNKLLENQQVIEHIWMQDAKKKEALAQYHGVVGKVMHLFLGGNPKKKIAKLAKESKRIQEAGQSDSSIVLLPGYVLQRKFTAIDQSGLYKTILTKYNALYGKRYVVQRTKHLLAKLLSYPILGMALSLLLGALALGAGNLSVGLAILIVGTLLILLLVYAQYDEVQDQANRRCDAIRRQFPNVVSKLALLVTSGMIMDRAWKETARSQKLELYREMQLTADELDNLVNPQEAYTNFINRCNTKETTKLASAILQNQSKGNAEIGILLKDMAREAWEERRHTAKRDSEKANSKLMIPTMLLLVAILVMIMVPVAINFSNL